MDAAWVGLIGIIIGVILSELIRWLRERGEGEEKYRVMLYEKRLEVHQKAFYYVEQLMDQLRGYFERYEYPNRDELAAIYREARGFYYSNSLYLDELSRAEMR